MKITVLAIGKARGIEADWCAEYAKRISCDVVVKEFIAATQKLEGEVLLKNIPDKSFVVILDEHGKDLTSRDFAAKVKSWEEQGRASLVFLIGGADGVTDAVKQRADFTLGFGRATWPHRLVRVMLLEQIYRAQQINARHPYHRD
jgi:23S rRNA (pseudouridine1915-N3)-methyltransferase